MKKTAAGILAAALILILGGTTVSAVGLGRQDNNAVRSRNVYTTDNVCDNYSTQGICDGDGRLCAPAQSCYTDADGDGICDHRNESTSSAGLYSGCGRHEAATHHSGHGYGHR